jgi:hypothetical protein
VSANRLERLGQVGFVAMSLTVTVAAVQYIVNARTAAARPAPPPAVAVGTKLPLPVDATDGGRTAALLAVLSSECRFCTESMPFYKRLMAHPKVAAGGVKFQVVSVQPPGVMRAYLSEHGLAPSAVLTAAETGAYVRGTPSLILTDSQGVVIDSWSGALPPEEERKVVMALDKLQSGGRE